MVWYSGPGFTFVGLSGLVVWSWFYICRVEWFGGLVLVLLRISEQEGGVIVIVLFVKNKKIILILFSRPTTLVFSTFSR